MKTYFLAVLALEERNELIKLSSPNQLAMQLISFSILKSSIPLQNFNQMENCTTRQCLMPILNFISVFLLMTSLTLWWCFFIIRVTLSWKKSWWKWWYGNCGLVTLITDAVCLLQSNCWLFEFGMLPAWASGAIPANTFFWYFYKDNTFFALWLWSKKKKKSLI